VIAHNFACEHTKGEIKEVKTRAEMWYELRWKNSDIRIIVANDRTADQKGFKKKLCGFEMKKIKMKMKRTLWHTNDHNGSCCKNPLPLMCVLIMWFLCEILNF
jgi:hypothetical protein